MKNITYILLFLTQVVLAQTGFEKGNELYRNGKYTEAAQAYESILKENKESAELYFNLGNAYYKSDKIAPAIYNYEKALLLSPNYNDAKVNLGFAQRMAIDDIKAAPKAGISKILYNWAGAYHYDTWAWVAVSGAVLCLMLFMGYYLGGSTLVKRIFFVGMCVSLLGIVLSIIFALFVKSEVEKDRPAIIFSEVVSVKSEPNNSAPDAFILHEGTKVNVTETLDNWKKNTAR